MAKITTKKVQLETVLREMVRDVIAEELVEAMGDFVGYDDWKAREEDRFMGRETPPDAPFPRSGAQEDWEDEMAAYRARQAEYDPSLPGDEFDDSERQERAPAIYSEPGGGRGVEDPEHMGMDPKNREKMIDALLDMEFQQEGASKHIPVATLREMIRESVRKHLTKKEDKCEGEGCQKEGCEHGG